MSFTYLTRTKAKPRSKVKKRPLRKPIRTSFPGIFPPRRRLAAVRVDGTCARSYGRETASKKPKHLARGRNTSVKNVAEFHQTRLICVPQLRFNIGVSLCRGYTQATKAYQPITNNKWSIVPWQRWTP